LDHGRFLQLTFSRLRFGRAPGNSVVAVLHAVAQRSAPRRSRFDLRTVKPAALSSAAGRGPFCVSWRRLTQRAAGAGAARPHGKHLSHRSLARPHRPEGTPARSPGLRPAADESVDALRAS